MNASPATLRSILDKPLKQLTEDDISQLTREDCRKYLKEKGMRRPSWNKSQAIQQVIFLKALLEPCEDSGAVALRNLAVSTRVALSPGDSAKEASDDTQPPLSTDEAVTTRQAEPSDSFQEDSLTDFYKMTLTAEADASKRIVKTAKVANQRRQRRRLRDLIVQKQT